jgi:hypothetical protein
VIYLNAFQVDGKESCRPELEMYQGIVEKDQYLAENVKGKVVMDVDVNQGMSSILAVEMPVRAVHAFEAASQISQFSF